MPRIEDPGLKNSISKEQEQSKDVSSLGDKKRLAWTFDGDGGKLRLASEAWRIKYAHLFDPYLAVHTSDVQPLPHQISAVYQEMLPRQPLRYVLADDPGAGKTIMTGLYISELVARGELARCLIVCPGSLAEQWQDELWQKFHLRFTILTNSCLEDSAEGNAFRETPLAIARLDKLARSDSIQAMLQETEWDLVVCDEAHKMSATRWGGSVRTTRRFRLGKLLSGQTRHFLLLTATPHNGKEEDFQLFLSLVDEDRFGTEGRSALQKTDVSDVMRRLTKEELLTFEGKPLFPERRAVTVNYTLTEEEEELYEAVTAYVQNEFNRADRLSRSRRNTVGFALTVLQRRLASSPEAIYQSLHRRRERLQQRLEEERTNTLEESRSGMTSFSDIAEDFDEEDYAGGELEDMEEKLADRASAASTLAELEAEIATLEHLEELANSVRTSSRDRKWEEVSRLLQDDTCMFDEQGNREKLIIFTEHKDTLNCLVDRMRTLLANSLAVVSIHGGMPREERRKTEDLFRKDPEVRILVATDAAGEGINLQRAHLMINYDLPWNPNRLEQRFGRIHRIGQTRICWLWNLVAAQTREGSVFDCLFRKLNQEREALGGKVFDILGKISFDNKSLRDLLVDAVRYGDDVEEQIVQCVDKALDTSKLEALLAERTLTNDAMNVQTVRTIREDMERMDARRLAPYFIESFFREAFRALGGSLNPREKGRWKIASVPFILRTEHVLPRYERVCFDREHRILKEGDPPADLLCPGHPLFNAVVDELCRESAALLKKGAVLIDEQCDTSALRLLFYIEDTVEDGILEADGTHRVLSKEIHFVEMDEEGTTIDAGLAPYLDYRPASLEETRAVLEHLRTLPWPGEDVERLAEEHAASHIVPKHLAQVRAQRLAMLDRTEKDVRTRLKAAIRYWDSRAWELKQQENEGTSRGQMSSRAAEHKAEELAARLDRRLEELKAERAISARPPRIVGGAIVVPVRRLADSMGRHEDISLPVSADAQARREVELAAMQAVMDLERELGFVPRDVSAEKCGYDIESHAPREDAPMRFIEVKGRAAGAKTVTVTRNEMLCALNRPDNYILAIVEVDGERTHTIYLGRPFTNTPDFSVECSTFNLSALSQGAVILLEK